MIDKTLKIVFNSKVQLLFILFMFIASVILVKSENAVFGIMTYLIALMVAFLRRSYNPRMYEENGSQGDWYDRRLKKLGVSWAEEFADQMISLINKDSFTLASPSANKGIYEKQMYSTWKDKHGLDPKVICSDLANIDYEKEYNPASDESYFKYYPCKNAMEIDSYTENDCDIIFDMKGALWYSKRFKQGKLLIDKYLEVLTDEGFLIIDAEHYNLLEVFFCEVLHIFNKNVSTVEESTKKRLQRNKKLKQYLEKHFNEVREIHVNANNRTMAFVVYRKIN